ncbi:Uncharacterised protein [uncultured archaeon]|nr:Uncharacterised protein [uncultured archaeon]
MFKLACLISGDQFFNFILCLVKFLVYLVLGFGRYVFVIYPETEPFSHNTSYGEARCIIDELACDLRVEFFHKLIKYHAFESAYGLLVDRAAFKHTVFNYHVSILLTVHALAGVTMFADFSLELQIQSLWKYLAEYLFSCPVRHLVLFACGFL